MGLGQSHHHVIKHMNTSGFLLLTKPYLYRLCRGMHRFLNVFTAQRRKNRTKFVKILNFLSWTFANLFFTHLKPNYLFHKAAHSFFRCVFSSSFPVCIPWTSTSTFQSSQCAKTPSKLLFPLLLFRSLAGKISYAFDATKIRSGSFWEYYRLPFSCGSVPTDRLLPSSLSLVVDTLIFPWSGAIHTAGFWYCWNRNFLSQIWWTTPSPVHT